MSYPALYRLQRISWCETSVLLLGDTDIVACRQYSCRAACTMHMQCMEWPWACNTAVNR